MPESTDANLSFAEMAAQDNAAAAAAVDDSPAAADTTPTEEPSDASPDGLQNASDAADGTPAADAGADAGTDGDGPDDDASVDSVRGWFKAVLGDDADDWIDKYADDEALARGVANLQKRLGQRDDQARWVDALQRAGVTPDDLQALIHQKATGAPPASPAAATPEWDPAWAARDAEGNIVPTAAAPADFQAKLQRYQAQLQEAMLDPSKLAKLVAPHLPNNAAPELEQKIAAQERQAWIDKRREALYVGDDMSPLGKRVDEILTSGMLNPGMSWTNQANAALQMAERELGRKPPATPKVPKLAKREPRPAKTAPKKMSDDEWFEKNGGSLFDFLKHAGDVPADAT